MSESTAGITEVEAGIWHRCPDGNVLCPWPPALGDRRGSYGRRAEDRQQCGHQITWILGFSGVEVRTYSSSIIRAVRAWRTAGSQVQLMPCPCCRRTVQIRFNAAEAA